MTREKNIQKIEFKSELRPIFFKSEAKMKHTQVNLFSKKFESTTTKVVKKSTRLPSTTKNNPIENPAQSLKSWFLEGYSKAKTPKGG